jgi:DNA polymerase-3 subunit gamma/tau
MAGAVAAPSVVHESGVALDAPARTAPPGNVLPVVDAGVRPPSSAAVPAAPGARAQARDTHDIVAVSVRAHSDAGVEAPTAASRLVRTEEGDFWHRTVQQLVQAEAIAALVRELALQSQLVARDTDQWVLRVERESLNQGSTRERLQNALRNHGHPVALVVEVGRVTDSPSRRNQAAQEERQLAAERLVFEDPFVQAMMRDFGAKIVPGSIKPA